METALTRRTGELTGRALHAAVSAEVAAGGTPLVLAVGSDRLYVQAVRILGPREGGLDRLRSILPNVEVDPMLGAGEWELRP